MDNAMIRKLVSALYGIANNGTGMLLATRAKRPIYLLVQALDDPALDQTDVLTILRVLSACCLFGGYNVVHKGFTYSQMIKREEKRWRLFVFSFLLLDFLHLGLRALFVRWNPRYSRVATRSLTTPRPPCT
jgi:hypothetical protein